MNDNPPPRPRFSSRRPPPRRAMARRGRPGGLPRFTTGSARDAINLRWNYKDAINLATGEWTRAGYRAPACYVTNARPIVHATFSAAPADLPSVTLLAETDAAIGGFAATNVAFAGGAASDVALSTKSATTNCILKETFDLTWKAVVSNGTEIVTNVIGKTDGHVLYTILGEPVEPWNNTKITNQNAWASALDVVCSNGWSLGLCDETNVAARIACAIFDSGRFHYETNHGTTMFVIRRHFALTRFLETLSSRGNADLNCSDCARAVTSLGNLVGCSLWSSVMENPFNRKMGFTTNPYCAIGRDEWTPPGWGWSFSYHEVAWSGSAQDSDLVFDACLQYDGDADPTTTPRAREQPVAVVFSDGNVAAPLVYRERLTPPTTGGYDKCRSVPIKKMRLPVR